jgi:dienelactone hydrolase
MPSPYRRLLRWLLILVVAAAAILYLVLPFVVGVTAVLPIRQAVGPPPPGFSAVELETEDGVALAGWYAPPANGAAVILVHGAGGSREDVRPYAEMLAGQGYGVLALDLRGHGMSDGKTNRLGWQSTPDVGAAVRYLQAREDVDSIGALGLSLGAEVLLGAASAYPALEAIVADGATRRSAAELTALPSERSLRRNFTARVMYASVRLLSGETPPLPLLASMTAADSTAFLLIAAGAEELEVQFNELFAQTLGERATLWIAPEAAHTGARRRYPAEYETRVLGFFDRRLLAE